MEKTLQREVSNKEQGIKSAATGDMSLRHGEQGGIQAAQVYYPLILLPFILLFYYIFHSWGGAKQPTLVQKDSIPANQINPNMPGYHRKLLMPGSRISSVPILKPIGTIRTLPHWII